jgi:hypothetical protein
MLYIPRVSKVMKMIIERREVLVSPVVFMILEVIALNEDEICWLIFESVPFAFGKKAIPAKLVANGFVPEGI